VPQVVDAGPVPAATMTASKDVPAKAAPTKGGPAAKPSAGSGAGKSASK